jgi:hypothetical protein
MRFATITLDRQQTFDRATLPHEAACTGLSVFGAISMSEANIDGRNPTYRSLRRSYRAIALSSRSTASRNGSVSEAGSESRTESFGP